MHACQPFPVKVLLGRLEQDSAPWSSFLPDDLRPKQVSAKVFYESASTKAQAEATTRRGDYTPVGISVFGRVWEYSQDAAGCREVQLAIEMADEESRWRIAAELQDHASWLHNVSCEKRFFTCQLKATSHPVEWMEATTGMQMVD